MAVTWDSINEGDALPEMQKKPSLTQMVKFAAGNWDFNPLHHDFKYFACEYLGSVLLQGHYRYAVLGELVQTWLGHNQGGRIKTIFCEHRGMDFPDAEISCQGTVAKKYEENGQKLVDLTIWTQDAEGKQKSPGKATVVFD